ncbi:hypothetical protein [Marinoscillum furvescens]|uniref:Uncharacterized protein n=1 Tax=Marinoscillum furvescens DSM 4134 TaxID=1122208 RepID=A0A3D9KYW3_MARFU|nr:hypothetical protein [Marinoscillum furvescens]RED95232.1 hypothetical protein C7460_1189 [Marinoscillum furvescens DSM 4134]
MKRILYLTLIAVFGFWGHSGIAQVNVTIEMDLSQQTDLGGNNVQIYGEFNGWGNPTATYMTDLGNGIHSYTFTIDGTESWVVNDVFSFSTKYWTGSQTVREENVPNTCTNCTAFTNSGQPSYRKIVVPASDATYRFVFDACERSTYSAGSWDITPTENSFLDIQDDYTFTSSLKTSGMVTSSNTVTVSSGTTLEVDGSLETQAALISVAAEDVESASTAADVLSNTGNTTYITTGISSTVAYSGSKSVSVERTATNAQNNKEAIEYQFALNELGTYRIEFYAKSSGTASNSAWTNVYFRSGWPASGVSGFNVNNDSWTKYSLTGVEISKTGNYVMDIRVPNELGTFYFDDFKVLKEETNDKIIVESGASLITYAGFSDSLHTVVAHRTTSHSNGQYSFVGSPVYSETDSTKDLGMYVYSYDESVNFDTDAGLSRWIDQSANGNVTTLDAGIGYAAAGVQNLTFTGIPNVGTIEVSGLSHTPSASSDASNYGWNLLSNPYLSAINIEAFLDTNAHITQSVAIWDDGGSHLGRGSNSDYLTVNAIATVNGKNKSFEGYIGSMQGFFVQVLSDNTSVKFTESMRVTGNNSDATYFRTAQDRVDGVKLSLQTVDGKLQNELFIGLLEDATAGIDPEYDAPKLHGNDNLQFYSLIDDRKFAIQGIELAQGSKATLAYDLKSEESLKITVNELKLSNSEMTLLLHDAITGLTHNLTETTEIEFRSKAGSDQNRFTLTYGLANVLSSELASAEPLYRYLNGTLSVDFQEALEVSEFAAYDLSGQLITHEEGITGTTRHLDIPLHSKGITIVKIVTSKGQFTRKFIF